ncbi:MAG: protoheme IX farnesyltransferase [Candidatus Omnitrophica bacterium]|nr:protoheme IX farnesyltransferase [Candidatus Omnitrophota bacterium]
MNAYLELTKPRLSALVLFTMATGYWMGLRETQPLWRFLAVGLGTALVVGGANALNEWMERDLDARMERTKQRPLPEGRLSPERAYRFGVALSVLGILVLGLMVNFPTAFLAMVGWASYVLVYTPLKRMTPLCTLVGAIPGALPPMIGWAGSHRSLGFEAWALFALLFVWQLPHFLALAVLYRSDYARAGFRMLALLDSDGAITARQTLIYGLVLVPVSLYPSVIGIAQTRYFYGAIALSLAFFAIAAWAAFRPSLWNCRRLFLSSIIYLPGLLVWLLLNRSIL